MMTRTAWLVVFAGSVVAAVLGAGVMVHDIVNGQLPPFAIGAATIVADMMIVVAAALAVRTTQTTHGGWPRTPADDWLTWRERATRWIRSRRG